MLLCGLLSGALALPVLWKSRLALKSGAKVQLRSRNDNDFSVRYPGIVKALAPMPDETVIKGEVVALDKDGRPWFNTLQNYGSEGAPLHSYIFDLLILEGRDVMGEPLVNRRELLEEHVLPRVASRSGIPPCWGETGGPDPLREGAGTRRARCKATKQQV